MIPPDLSAPPTAICAAYQRIAPWYATARTATHPPMEAPWLRAMLAHLAPGEAVLDLGCGTGEPLAGFCLRAGHPVTGIDGAPAMIAACRERFPAMDWIVGDMRGLDLGRTFGAVMAWDSFFHLSHDDQRAMFPVFNAHLRPGGALLFTSGPHHGEATGVMDGVAFRHCSLSPDAYRRLLAGHGFAVEGHVAKDPACGGHTVWLARKED